MKFKIIQLINQSLSLITGKTEPDSFSVVVPKPEFGDLASNVALVIAKKNPELGKNGPQALAETLVKHILANPESHIFANIHAQDGFINFTYSQNFLIHWLNACVENMKSALSLNVGADKLVVVEYFQNNVAKPPHVGHLRSAVIGDSLARLYKFLGFRVVTDTHIGDWGTQFGVLLLAYKTMGNPDLVKQSPIAELNKLYVAMSQKIKSNEVLYEQAKAEFKKLEDGDVENRKLWQWFVEESLLDFRRYCELLNLLPFDFNLGESFYESLMPEVLREFERKGLITVGETRERYVDLEAYGLGRCILVKSDGATTYHLRDFATYIYRKREWDFYQNLYVVDNRQSHHFKQLFKVLELAGYSASQDSRLIGFGFMSLPAGAISTREGNVISLEHLLTEAQTQAMSIIQQKNPNLANPGEVSIKVARAAIKYFDLSHNRQSNIVFTWEKAVSFEGNTGPYLLYTYARIHGIFQKNNYIKHVGGLESFLTLSLTNEEFLLMRKTTEMGMVLETAAEQALPNLICNYLFEIASLFNSFYEACPIYTETDTHKRAFRLLLISAVADILKTGLEILGLEPVTEM